VKPNTQMYRANPFLSTKYTCLCTDHRNQAKFCHGQYPKSGVHGSFGTSNRGPYLNVVDDHQSPLRPSEYLDLRLQPQLAFYQRRLPIYYRVRSICEVILVVGGLGGAILGFLQLETWSPVIAAATVAVSSWIEFSGVNKKLARFSDTVQQTDTICRWWQSLSDVDRANLVNIDQLVQECEALFQVERQAWLSTSMTNKLMTKQTKGGSANHGSNDGAASNSAFD
jgi:hypothetical protein